MHALFSDLPPHVNRKGHLAVLHPAGSPIVVRVQTYQGAHRKFGVTNCMLKDTRPAIRLSTRSTSSKFRLHVTMPVCMTLFDLVHFVSNKVPFLFQTDRSALRLHTQYTLLCYA
jgi:hypothetical protein